MTVTRRKKGKKKLLPRLTATCAAGLEELVRTEVEGFGGQGITVFPGAVSWRGRLASGYRACLWSRFASRILLEIDEFGCSDTDTLYQRVKQQDWSAHLDPAATFAVGCTLAGTNTITHSRFATLRVKDGIVDHFRERTGRRPEVDRYRPDLRINLHLRDNRASLAIDLSGEPLHRRGYRRDPGPAPLRETLAAAICGLAGVNEHPWPVLLDPLCGSGTLLIEAALLLSDSAPGLQRKRFGFMGWQQHNQPMWERLVQEALAREEAGLAGDWPRIIGLDADPRAVAAARANIDQAGLADRIEIRQAQLADLDPPGTSGLLITNPPYGERLSEKETVRYLYRFLGRRFTSRFAGWRLGFFSSHPEMADFPGLKWDRRYRLHNGPIRCRLLVGESGEPTGTDSAPLAPCPAPRADNGPGSDLANRIRKNHQYLTPWLERESIHCYRIYDADIPEFNLAVDIYGPWLHVQEYAPPAGIAPEKSRERFKLALKILAELFTLDRRRIFIKTRRPQKGRGQYGARTGKRKPGALPRLVEVREDGARFLVNLTDYLDTGLFLDHRQTRARIGQMAAGTRFLNLFGYTGTATVYAAMNQARATTTVDTSDRYLAWARANLAVNGLGGPMHRMVRADCLEWLREDRDEYGLIFVDPPTFSNQRHRGRQFSVQKDHPRLLRLAMARLAPEGILIFSTNYRKFRMDPELGREFRIREITDQTLPPDFRRRKIHRSYLFEGREQ